MPVQWTRSGLVCQGNTRIGARRVLLEPSNGLMAWQATNSAAPIITRGRVYNPDRKDDGRGEFDVLFAFRWTLPQQGGLASLMNGVVRGHAPRC